MNILSFQIISTFLSLLGVILAAKQKVIKWPIGIAANIFAILIYKKSQLNIKSIITFLFLIDSFYGWYKWLYGGENRQPIKVSKSNYKILIFYILLFLFIVLIFGKIEFIYTKNKISYIEAFAIFSILAHWMMARKKIETWWIWIFLDLLYIFVCIYKSLYVFAFKYFIYIILAIYGYLTWEKSLNR